MKETDKETKSEESKEGEAKKEVKQVFTYKAMEQVVFKAPAHSRYPR